MPEASQRLSPLAAPRRSFPKTTESRRPAEAAQAPAQPEKGGGHLRTTPADENGGGDGRPTQGFGRFRPNFGAPTLPISGASLRSSARPPMNPPCPPMNPPSPRVPPSRNHEMESHTMRMTFMFGTMAILSVPHSRGVWKSKLEEGRVVRNGSRKPFFTNLRTTHRHRALEPDPRSSPPMGPNPTRSALERKAHCPKRVPNSFPFRLTEWPRL